MEPPREACFPGSQFGFGTKKNDGGAEGLPMTASLQQLLLAYLPLVIFIGVSAVIGLALLLSSFIVAYKNPDP